MAMTTEQTAEFNASLSLLGAEELRAMKGDDPEEDALIDTILNAGKAVEMKVKPATRDDDDDKSPSAAATLAKEKEDNEDDEDPPATAVPANAGVDQATLDAAATKSTVEPAAAAAEDLAAPEIKDVSAEIPALDLNPLNTEYNNGIAELDAAKAEKLAALMAGDIDAAAYAKYEADYMNGRDQLREKRADQREWFTDVHNFKLEIARTVGINYDTDLKKAEALNDWCMRLAKKPENAGRDDKLILRDAHQKVMAEFGLNVASAAAAPAVAKPVPAAAAKPAKAGRAPDLSTLPPSIGGLPAAAETEAGDGGEFSSLDKLTGMEYEQALARLSPNQKNRYEMA